MLGLRSRFPWSPFVCNRIRTASNLSMWLVETRAKRCTSYSTSPVVAPEYRGFMRKRDITIASSTIFVHGMNFESENIVKKRTHWAHFKLILLPPETETQNPHPWHC